MTKKQIQPYQDTFMELDPTCKGTLDIDELKVVMVTLGFVLDEDELEVSHMVQQCVFNWNSYSI
jgi:Ca2+-binding EF-hand superfamily protein